MITIVTLAPIDNWMPPIMVELLRVPFGFGGMQFLIAIVVVGALWLTEAKYESGLMNGSLALPLTIGGLIFLAAISLLGNQVFKIPKAQKTNLTKSIQWFYTVSWLLTSIGIFACGQWGVMVREHWGLSRWILIDELLIIAPIIVPWLFHWWLESGRSNESESDRRPKGLLNLRERIAYCGLRVQVYCALTLVPMLILWTASDFVRFCGFEDAGPLKWTVLFVAFGLSTLLFPWLLTCIWPNQRIKDPVLRQRIADICSEKKVRITDFRVWQTGNQISNAMVTGFFWPCRILWLSDGLIEMLERDELEAVVRHEIGHLKRRHVEQRLLLLLLPVFVVSFIVLLFPDRISEWAERFISLGVSAEWITWVVLPSFGLMYLFWTLSWLSEKIEKDADIEACMVANRGGSQLSLDSRRVLSFKSALGKIAGQVPGGIYRKTFLHPSILDRATFLSELSQEPAKLLRFRQQLFLKMLLLLTLIVSGVIVFLFV